MGRIITRLFDRFFNSPKNFDEVSFKKTKNLIYQLIFLAVLCYILFFIVAIKDSMNPLTFITTELEDTIECPLIRVKTRNTIINNFSVNDLNVTQDFNTLNYANEYYCMRTQPMKYDCYNEAKNEIINSAIYTNDTVIEIEPYNITFQNNYLNLNFQSYVSMTSDGFAPPLGFVLLIGSYVYSFTGPIKIQILLKKEKFIDEFGMETTKFVPNVITSLMSSLMCEDYNSGNYIYNCSSSTITLIYETNIVTTYKVETALQLLLRMLKDTFSIGRVVVGLTSLAISFYGRKFLFKSKTAWFDNSIRDVVLFHFNYHELEPEQPKPPVIISKKQKSNSFISKLFNRNKSSNNQSLTNMEQELLKDYDQDEAFESIPLGEIGGSTTSAKPIEDEETETMGSKSRMKRLLQSMSIKDKYSQGLSKISIAQYITTGAILLGIAIFIGQRDSSNRLVTTNFSDKAEIELPKFTFSFESVKNSTWYTFYSYDETLPNGGSRICEFNILTHIISNGCKEDINSTVVSNFPGFSYTGTEITLEKDQVYSLSVMSAYVYTEEDVSKDSMYIKFELNNLMYYLRPFSDITIELTKSVFHQNDGSEDIVTYEPSILALPTEQASKTSNNITLYAANTILNIKYSNNIVRDIYMETTQQLIFRSVIDFFAYTSPVQTVVGILFINIIIKIVYKHSTAHSDFSIRTAVIYHMKHFEKYSTIYKKNNHLKNKTNIK